MAQRTQRPLSEIEIQILDSEIIPPDKTKVFASAEDIDRLQPPSLEELEAIDLPSLEELHREHAYTSLHSQVVKNVKERMKHFDRQNRRKSFGGTTEKEIQNEYGKVTDSEKDRKSQRRNSSVDRRKRRSYGGNADRGKEDTMTESEKTRRERKKNFEKHQRRMSYHAATDGRLEYIKSFDILQRSRSCGSRPIKVKEKEPDVLTDREITEKENEKNLAKLKLECVYQNSSDNNDIIQSELDDCLEGLLDKFNIESCLHNKENTIGRKDTLTNADQGCSPRKDTLTSADQDIYMPRSRNNTLENG